jgi:hypothetical protein
LVILSFRDFPEFGGLAPLRALGGYIIDLQDEMTVNQRGAVTLFFL